MDKNTFAASPVGGNRFRASQSPVLITDYIYNLSQPYDFSPQKTVNGNEDCPYLGPGHGALINVFAQRWLSTSAVDSLKAVVPSPSHLRDTRYSISHQAAVSSSCTPTTALMLSASCEERRSQNILIQTYMQDFSTSRRHCNGHTSTSSSSKAIQRTSSVYGPIRRRWTASLVKSSSMAAKPTLCAARP